MNNKKITEKKLDSTKKESYRKYNIVAVFSATQYGLKLPKEKDKRLREIKKEITDLYKEQKELLK